MSLFKYEKIFPGTSVFTPSKADDIGLTIVAQSGQTAKLFDAQDSTGVSKWSLDSSGNPIGSRFAVTAPLAAASVDNWAFIAPRACKIVSIKEVHSVVGGSSAAVSPRKVTDVSAPGAAAGATVKELCTAGFDLTATANTVVTGTLSATASDYAFAAGDKLGLDFSGTLTGLVGHITFEFQTV